MAQEPHRPWFQSLPTDCERLTHEDRLGPSIGYIFPKSYSQRRATLKLLQQWVDGVLPESCPIRHLNVYHYTPALLLGHYNDEIQPGRPRSEIKPVWFFTHLVRIPLLWFDPNRCVLTDPKNGHWVRQFGTTDVKAKDGTKIGSMRKLIYYSTDHIKHRCYKTEYRMEEYSLATYPDREYNIDTKFGAWIVVRIYVTKQRNRINA